MSESFRGSDMETFLGRPPSINEGRNSQLSLTGVLHMGQLKKVKNNDKSLDALSPAETAAHLAQKASSSQSKDKVRRYRTNRVLQHHQLAAELLQSKHSTESQAGRPNESDSEDSFVMKQQVTSRRSKIAPKEVNIPQAKLQSKANRHLYASSSGESEFENVTSGRRTPPDSSDDEAVLRRQQRRRRTQGSELIVLSSGPQIANHGSISAVKGKNNPQHLNDSPSSESNGMSSEIWESSSTADSSDSDDESTTLDERPQFIPRKRRGLEKSYEQIQQADEERSRIRADRMRSRKLESRAMVTKQAVLSAPNTDQDYMEESYGASNVIPDDGNISDEDVLSMHREAWELREIERLLATLKKEWEKESGRQAYERRKQLTDEQVMDEDKRSGRYVQPGRIRLDKGSNPHRYYHRGAYYMDDEEWDDADVRYKSSEYAQAVTGEDKLDKSRLPEIMRRKNFGFARQNTKYKGLAAEDTSDARVQVLPIVGRKTFDCRNEK